MSTPPSERGKGLPGAESPPDRWERLSELLNAVVPLPDEARSGFLDEACLGSPELRAEVEELLRAHGEEGRLDRLEREVMAPLLEAVRRGSRMMPEPSERYQLREELGRGGMGVVHRAHDLLLDREVALKFLPSHLLAGERARDRFLREARAAAKLEHPNICTIHEIGESPEGGLFISMPLYEGETLKRRLSIQPLPWRDAVHLGEQVARGLARAHAARIVHRDVKPANLFLTEEGVVKILDFGIAKVAGSGGTKEEEVLGTAAYMSPEQARGEPVTGRSDLWSLGAVLYETLTGERLFTGEDQDAVLATIRSSEPLPLGRLQGLAPAPVLEVLGQTLVRDPAQRMPSAEVLARRLREVRELSPEPGPEAPFGATDLAPEGERRQVTVLALRVSGYDALLERTPSGELEDRMARLYQAVEEVARRHGGFPVEAVRDRIVVVFGIPVTHEDDVLRALRTAGELHGLAAAGPERWGEEPLSFQAGIATGTIVARRGSGSSSRYHLAGALPEAAAGLAAEARPGESRLDVASRRIAPTELDPEPVSPPPGDEARTRSWPEEGAGSPPASLPQTTFGPSELTAYTGRDAELENLHSLALRAVAGDAQFVTVIGEAGMGKSRLLLELRFRLGDGTARILHGQCQSYAGRGPYHPFLEIVLQILGLERAPGPEAEDRVIEALRAIDEELERYLPFYLHLLSVPSRRFPPPPGLLQGEQFRARMREALIGLLTLACDEEPTLLLLEDWHWADDASRELLTQIAGAVAGHRLMVVVAARPGYGTEWDAAEPWILVQLRPLPSEASARMVKALLGGAGVPEEVGATLHDRTGGNPFFLEELCRSLEEAGVLRVAGGQASLRRAQEGLHLPSTIQGVIRTRLDRLPSEAREVAREAAVLGRDFSLSLLKRLGPERRSIRRALDHLIATGVLQQTRALPEPRLRFKHALTQEVAYDTLLQHQRVALHERAGRALEELHPDRVGEEAPRLAHHFSRAERWSEAVRHGLVAARRARELAEFSDALQTLEEVDGWIARLPPGPRRRNAEVDAILRQEELCETLGLRGRQQELLERVGELVADGGEERELIEVQRRKGDVYTLLRRFDEAEGALAGALDLAREVKDPALQGSVLRSLGLTEWHQGRTREALAHIDEALRLDRERGDTQAIIADLNNKAKVLKDREEYPEALLCLEEALELLEQTPSEVKSTYLLHNMASMHRASGDPERALELLETAERLSRERHLPVQGAFHLTSMAHIHLAQGNLEKALDAYREAVSVARRSRYAEGLAHSLKPLGDLLARIDREAEALPYLQEAARIFAQLGNPETEAEVCRAVAKAAEGAGDPERALEAWSRCRELAADEGNTDARISALEGMARAHREMDPEPGRAREALDEALALARSRNSRRREAGLLNSLGILHWTAGAWEEALAAYEGALEAFRELGEEAHAGLMMNSLAATLARLGRREEARSLLEEALDAHRRTGEPLLEGHALAALGDLALEGQDLEHARERFVRSLEIRRTLGDRKGEGWMHQRLALVNQRSGRLDAARAYLEAARGIAEEAGDAELLRACDRIPR